MLKALPILGLLALIPFGTARAVGECYVPMADWAPPGAVAQYARARGWTVRRIRIRDGCYEIDGMDGHGRAIAVTMHPVKLRVVGVEYGNSGLGGKGADRDRRREEKDSQG